MDIEGRISALEQAVAALRAAGSSDAGVEPQSADPDFWALDGLKARMDEGAVIFAGNLEVPDRGPIGWQMGATTERLSAADWSDVAPVLDALAHPVRLQLLQLVFGGVRTTAELAAQESLGSTGQVHHHLRILVAAGWLVSRARGTYDIPGTRVVPLLVTLLAARSE